MTERKKEIVKECFIIMPIAEVDGYPDGHFKHVYENIISPACEMANYKAVRADQVKQTNLIHLDILKKLIEAPLAICDLSTRNPNVLFELGIRQAFDKPVVLIQESGTQRIFDIAPLRYLEYSKEMKYHDVLKVQNDLKESIEATANAGGEIGNVNSIVKLLALNNPAQIPDIENNRDTIALDYLQAEMRDMRMMIESSLMKRGPTSKSSIAAFEYQRLSDELTSLQNTKRISPSEREERFMRLMKEADMLMMESSSKEDHQFFRTLMERIHRAAKDLM